jgi:pilus assembly protein CpaB
MPAIAPDRPRSWVVNMKPAKLAVLGLSLAGAAGAMYFAQKPRAPEVVETPSAGPQLATDEVLVIKINGEMGQVLKAEDIGWETWPKSSIQPLHLTKASGVDLDKEIIGSMLRQSFLAGEPLRRERLIRTDGTGFMSAILPSGMRAVSIAVDGSGSDVAGGFILPNDRVDILRTFTNEGSDEVTTETLLRNIRVLAIGTQVKEEDGKTTIIAGNATLELNPAQVETVTLAQRTGKLSLALRALADNAKKDEPTAAPVSNGMTIIRMGVPQKIGGAAQ